MKQPNSLLLWVFPEVFCWRKIMWMKIKWIIEIEDIEFCVVTMPVIVIFVFKLDCFLYSIVKLFIFNIQLQTVTWPLVFGFGHMRLGLFLLEIKWYKAIFNKRYFYIKCEIMKHLKKILGQFQGTSKGISFVFVIQTSVKISMKN